MWQPPAPPRRQSNAALIAVAIAVGVVVAIAAVVTIVLVTADKDPIIDRGPAPTAAASTAPAEPVQEVTATDQSSKLTVPQKWSRLELNDVAVLEYGHKASDGYVMVLEQSRKDFTFTLEEFSDTTIKALSLTDKVIGPAEELKVGGLKAIRRRVAGTFNQTKVVYWHTAVLGRDHYFQVLTWSLASQADARKSEYDKIVSTFREL